MGIRSAVRNSFLTGLLLVAPLAVTILVLRIVFRWLLGIINPVVRGTNLVQYTANVELLAQVLAAVLIALSLTILGYLASRSLGQQLFGGVDRAIGFIPLVSIVYSSVRQVADALVERESRYDRVVLVEFPRDGVYAIGFVTGDAPSAARRVTGEETYNVFFPNSPNPTAGRLALVPESQVHETDLGVGRGIRMLVTTGMATTQEEVVELREEPEPPVATES